MNNIDIRQANDMIAVFMGREPINFSLSHAEKNYHNTWNILMTAVERVERDLYLYVQISGTNCFIHWMGAEPSDSTLLNFLKQYNGIDEDGVSKISATWNAIVKLLYQYNQFHNNLQLSTIS